jgi:hypothetical protein
MKRIEFQVEDEQYEFIKEGADAHGMSIGGYVRYRAVSQMNTDEKDTADVGSRISSLEGKIDKVLEKIYAEPAASIEKNPLKVRTRVDDIEPYEGWIVEPAPDGSTSGYYSEHHGQMVKVIFDPQRPNNKQILTQDNPWYETF